MGRNIPQTGTPIAANIVENVANDHDIDTETVQEILDAVQECMGHFIDEYRDDAQIVAETDEILITLSEWGFREEARDVRERTSTVFDEELSTIISNAHHAAFKSATFRALTDMSSQDATGATSTQYPRIIRKPEDAHPPTGDLDVEYRIQYEHGYEAPYNFVARATAEVSGEYGTLDIERTYRAVPDDNSAESRDEIIVSSEATHAESATIVSDSIETWDIREQIPYKSGRFTEYDDDLRRWVYDNHAADFEAEYEEIARTIHICDECGAYPSDHVKVEQRSTLQFDPSALDVFCNHCYADLLGDITALSRQEAEVYALKESGLSHRQIADALGGLSKSQVGTVMGRIRDKQERSERTAELIRDE